MQVGADSYVTVPEADAYIVSHYRRSSADRQRWDTLLDEDKAVLLVMACAEMELLPFHGRKAAIGQALAFPRLPYQYCQPQEPPADVKAAQIELALWLSNDAKQTELAQRRELQRQGVKAFSIGDLSESYAEGAGAKPAPLACAKSAVLLARYLNGGYALC